MVADLNLLDKAREAVKGIDVVYNLACNMGGMGFIENNKGLCMISVLINTHLLMAAKEYGVKRFFYASSACVYNGDKQTSKSTDVFLKEEDAYPAMPEDGYGWEKLFSERMCRHFREDWKVPTRVARFHNVYGPFGTWEGGREKAPAAMCRKVIEAKLTGNHNIEIWGDGKQTRSFMYISDCLKGIYTITDSETWHDPINLGSSEGVTINQLVDMVEDIAGIKLNRSYNLERSQGRQRPQQRQHAHQESLRLGARHAPPRRDGEDLQVDLRPDGPPLHRRQAPGGAGGRGALAGASLARTTTPTPGLSAPDSVPRGASGTTRPARASARGYEGRRSFWCSGNARASCPRRREVECDTRSCGANEDPRPGHPDGRAWAFHGSVG